MCSLSEVEKKEGLKIQEIKEKNVWEGFLLRCVDRTFLQSWNWGEFNEKMGNKIWRLGISEASNLVAVVLVIKITAKRGTFLLIQHGPNLIQNSKFKIQNDNLKLEVLEKLLNELKKIGKQEGCSFIRIAPLWERNDENLKIFKDLGLKEAPMHANAYEATLKLDISLSEEELLKKMRKTTRYLIRQAQKNNDIEIFQSRNINDVETFNQIHQEVVKAQKFIPFSLKYFKNEFSVFQKNDQVRLFFGKYKGEIIASAFILFWSNIAFYHHAALLPQYHKIPVSYLLLWEAIKEAKKRRCALFDFWGFVDPKKQPNHPWAGPTFFKMGFGGYKREYVKTQDLPLSLEYWLTYLFEKLRKRKRGL